MDSFTRRDSFVQQLFAQNRRRKRLFSLLYDGNLLTSDTLNFRESVSRKEHWEEREIVYDIEPGKLVLRLNMRIYRTFPIIECLPWLEYSGSEPGGLIEEFHSLVILVQFADAPFTVSNPQQAFDQLLNEEGYSGNNATGSARDYYKENSNGRFNPHFDVVGPFTLSGNQNSYDGHEARFIIESCNLAADNGVDFSPYVDNGILRDVFIFFAGYNQAEAGGSYLWPARMFYTDPNIDFGTWGGGRLLAAAYTSELKGSSGATMTGIGTFCHEFGHILGWPDFYDSDYNQNGTGFNLDIFSLMAAGSYVNGGKTPPAINAFERYMVGWATPEEITETGSYTLEPVYGDHSYRINTLNEGEYFILEFRNGNINRWDAFLQNGNTGSDIGYQAIGSGSGMLIYHVDQSNNRVGSYRAKDLWALNANKVNSFGDHECMRIFMASPVSRSNGVLRDFGKMFFPGDDNIRELTASQSPYFVGWDGFSTGFELYNITQNGTANVTFDVEKLKQGQIRDLVIDPGQSDIFISFFTPFNDKSPAEEIYATFGVSKKTFKKAVGDLYKKHLVTLEEGGIRLCEKPQRKPRLKP